MRLRQRGGFQPAPKGTYYAKNDTADHIDWVQTGTYDRGFTGEVVTMADEVVPGFFKRRLNGEVFFNPCSLRRHSIQVSDGTGPQRKKPAALFRNGVYYDTEYKASHSYIPSLFSRASGQNILTPFTPLPLLSDSDIAAESSLLQTAVLADRGRGGPNLFEDLAEADATLYLVPDLLEQIKKLFEKTRLRNKAKSLAALWLMYRYAVMPLIRDVADSIDVLHKAWKPVRETTRHSKILRGSAFKTFSFSGNTDGYSISVRKDDTCEIRAMSLDAYDRDLAYELGLSFKNVLTLPVELIPYEFVADWFVNVGDYVASFVPGCMSYQELGSCVTQKRTVRTTVTDNSSFGLNGYSIVTPMKGDMIVSTTEYTRSPGLSSSFQVQSDFGLDSANRVLDGISLLLQRMFNRRRPQRWLNLRLSRTMNVR